MAYVIRYIYPGTTNGKPVGLVFITGPHFGQDIWSHTKKVAEAATWDTFEEAYQELSRRSWRHNSAIVVEKSEARDLD